MKRALLLIILVVSMLEAAWAVAWHEIGQGTASCGTWTTLRHNRNALGPEQWVTGFSSGVAFTTVKDGTHLMV
jgi:hypothetical protein